MTAQSESRPGDSETTPTPTHEDTLTLARDLLNAGIPVIYCPARPGWYPGIGKSDVVLTEGWSQITAADCDITHADLTKGCLAMVAGHGVDVMDIDTKEGGHPDHLPPIEVFGVRRTPSGGYHFYVRSTGYAKVNGWHNNGAFLGDYCGGTAGGSGRSLVFLGGYRPKYPGADYTTEEPVDLDMLLEAQPDDTLVSLLVQMGARNTGDAGKPSASRADCIAFLAEHSVIPERQCKYGRKALAEMAEASVGLTPGSPTKGRHGWAIRTAARLVELTRSGCADARDWEWFSTRLHAIKPEEDPWEALSWGLSNADGEVRCGMHSGNPFVSVPTGLEDHEEAAPEPAVGLVLPDEFWDTDVLRTVRQAAHSAQLGAAGLLGAVLARVSMQTDYRIELPSTRNRGSLNLFVGLVVGSGGGKGSSVEVASRLLPGVEQSCMCGDHEEGDYITIPPGSGEGITRIFWDMVADGGSTRRTQRRDRHHVMLDVDEIESLIAITGRSGATIGPVLRSMWSGAKAGFQNSSADRKFPLNPGTYRVSMVAGVQPSVVGKIFDAEVMGGTPQRFLWVPAHGFDVPSIEDGQSLPAWPGELPPVQFAAIGAPWTPFVIEVDPTVKREMDVRRNRVARGAQRISDLDAHRDFLRLRVAALLARMHGEREVTPQWWALSGMVMDLSDATRTDMLRKVGEQTVQGVIEAGKRDHIRRVATVEQDMLRAERAAKSMWKVVAMHSEGGRHDEGSCAKRCALNAASSRYSTSEKREALELALERDWLEAADERLTLGRSQPV